MSSVAALPPKASRVAAMLAATAALGGCSSVGVLNALEPAPGPITRDIAFEGAGSRLKLDVYRPRPGAGPAPVVVFFYGGGWDSGRRQDYAFVGKALAAKGYLTVIPDYRLYPEVRWPAFLEDNAKAVRWAKDHGGEYGGDPTRMVLMGHSAGAYNAAMLTLDHRWLGAVGIDPDRDIRAMVGLAGPYDFLPLHSDELKIIFGPPEGRPDTQPVAHVTGKGPPLWLAADTGDKVVEAANSSRLAKVVRAKGGQVEERYYGGLSHALMVGTIAAPLRFLAPVLKDAAAFIDAHTRPGAAAMSVLIPVLVVLVFMAVVMAAGWATIARTGNAGWIDVFWTFGTGVAGVACALIPLPGQPWPAPRQMVVALLVAIWSLRLGSYITRRVATSHGEDARYAILRDEWGKAFDRNAFWFMQAQGPATVLLCLSILTAAHRPFPHALRLLDVAGFAILAAAIAGETLSDRQMRRFKADHANHGKVIDTGLWGWSRHPNYFFEWLGWLAYPVIAVDLTGAYPGRLVALLGPAFMYLILTRLTGVPPLETAMVRSKGEAYRAYQGRVSAFIPLPPSRRTAP